jgi:Uma2 family endonuclease
MTAAVRRRATYNDLLELPEIVVGEIVDGTLIATPRPASRHARASSRLGVRLGGAFDSDDGNPGGWILLDEPELHLGEDVLVPDMAGWRRHRMPEMPLTPAFDLASDWICEVLSPGTAALDRTQKLPIYAREGVAHAWLVDPIEQTLESFRRDGSL